MIVIVHETASESVASLTSRGLKVHAHECHDLFDFVSVIVLG